MSPGFADFEDHILGFRAGALKKEKKQMMLMLIVVIVYEALNRSQAISGTVQLFQILYLT